MRPVSREASRPSTVSRSAGLASGAVSDQASPDLSSRSVPPAFRMTIALRSERSNWSGLSLAASAF